jgi:probable addiction module antidote protein
MERNFEMTRALKHFDAAEHITDFESAAEFLDAVLEEDCDDPRYFAEALGALARSESMTEISRKTGISRKGLYKALSEDGNPTLETVLKVMGALGLRLRAERRELAPNRELAIIS